MKKSGDLFPAFLFLLAPIFYHCLYQPLAWPVAHFSIREGKDILGRVEQGFRTAYRA